MIVAQMLDDDTVCKGVDLHDFALEHFVEQIKEDSKAHGNADQAPIGTHEDLETRNHSR